MKIEVSYHGVDKNRTYFAAKAGAGRPRLNDRLDESSKRVYVTGATREEAIENFLDYVGFIPHAQRVTA